MTAKKNQRPYCYAAAVAAVDAAAIAAIAAVDAAAIAAVFKSHCAAAIAAVDAAGAVAFFFSCINER